MPNGCTSHPFRGASVSPFQKRSSNEASTSSPGNLSGNARALGEDHRGTWLHAPSGKNVGILPGDRLSSSPITPVAGSNRQKRFRNQYYSIHTHTKPEDTYSHELTIKLVCH